MLCKFSNFSFCQYIESKTSTVMCEGKPQDKAECPLWSGQIKPITFIRKSE